MTDNPLDDLTGLKLGHDRGYRREDLERYQRERLRATFLWARERASFYRTRLAGVAAPPRLEDIRRIPFTTAADLAADPLGFVCVSQDQIARVVTLETSGTTGPPKRLFFTADDQAITRDYFSHGLSLMTGQGDRVLVLLPQGNPGSLGDLLDGSLRSLGAHPIFVSGGSPPIEIMRRERPSVIIGAPVPVLALAQQVGSEEPFARCVLLCSDRIPKGIVRFLEESRGCAVFQDWGMTEMGYGGGVDCRAHCGYHLQEADFLFEIVNADTGKPVADGDPGEVVFTTLTRRGMPLIRYRTGDISRILPGACACGSPLRRLDRIETRKAGRIAIGGVEITLGALDDALFGIAGLADFRASFGAGRLRVEALAPTLRTGTAETDALERTIRAALDDLAPVRDARASGRLQTDVAIVEDPVVFSRRKRTLQVEESR